jgi:HD superfamily phosphohydrolase
MADSITQHSDDPEIKTLLGRDGGKNSWLQILRFAALCHDVGHGLMSHVSENALALTSDYSNLIAEFRTSLPKKKVSSQLSEIAAYYMLQTSSFNQLITLALEKAEYPPISQAAQKIADCVIGISNDPRVPLIHEFISGPFDCDKLDYMTRDALMCGVPVVTDVTRLVQKARAAQLTTETLDDDLKENVPNTPRSHRIIAIEHSGAGTLDEVALGRSLLHDKVYRHQKVRAAEVMVAAMIHETLPFADDVSLLTLPLRLFDEDLLALTGDDIRRVLGCENADLPAVTDISRRLRERDLFVRAFAFGERMPDVQYMEDPESKSSLTSLMRHSRDSKKRLILVDRVAAEATTMARLVRREEEIKNLPKGRLQPYIWLSAPPEKDSSTSDVLRGYLLKPDGSIGRLEDEGPAIRGVSDAYLTSREIGFVFCPSEFVDLVYLAMEWAIFDKYKGLVIPRSMGLLAHVDMERVDSLRRDLAAAGYYEGKPAVFKPEPKGTETALFGKRCRDAADRLSSYQGPFVQDTADRPGCVTSAGIREWVCQFPEQLIDCALAVASSILVMNRVLINKVIDKFLRSDAGSAFKGAALVPLGSPKDSSAILPYLSDVSGDYGLAAMSLVSALISDRPIMLLDDIIQKGATVEEIVAQLLGEPAHLTQGVEHVATLSPRAIDSMKARQLAIVTVAGAPDGVCSARESMERHGLQGIVDCYYEDFHQVPSVATALGSMAHRDEFVAFCQDIGKRLVAGEKNPEDRAYGYGGWGLLVTGMFNTPTATLTALWHEKVDGVPWRPLLRRRKKR